MTVCFLTFLMPISLAAGEIGDDDAFSLDEVNDVDLVDPTSVKLVPLNFILFPSRIFVLLSAKDSLFRATLTEDLSTKWHDEPSLLHSFFCISQYDIMLWHTDSCSRSLNMLLATVSWWAGFTRSAFSLHGFDVCRRHSASQLCGEYLACIYLTIYIIRGLRLKEVTDSLTADSYLYFLLTLWGL